VSPLCRRGLLWAAVALGTALVPKGAAACTSSVCQMAGRQQDDAPRRGRLRVDFTYRYADMATPLAGSRAADEVIRPYVDLREGRLYPGWHQDWRGQESLFQAETAFGITERTSVHATFPLQADRRMEGGDAVCENPYRARGLGDMTLGVRHAAPLAGGWLSVTVAVKMPTGPSGKKAAGAYLDPAVQPGSGSTDLVAGASFGVRGAGAAWTATASRQFTGRSGLDFAFGDETIVAVGAMRPLWGRLQASLQAKLVFRDRNTLAGATIPSSGSRVLYATPGLRLDLPGGLATYALLPLPLARYVNEAQLAPTRGLVVGVSRSF
jgi:hypothetical protein